MEIIFVFKFKVGYGDYYGTHFENLDRNMYENNRVSNDVNLFNDEDPIASKRNKNVTYYLKEFWKCVKSDPVHKDEMIKRAHFKGINSVSKCDRIARIFFPTSFFILNLFYWFKYYNK